MNQTTLATKVAGERSSIYSWHNFITSNMRKIIAVSVLGLSLAMFAGAQTPNALALYHQEQTGNTGSQPPTAQKREEMKTQIEAKKAELQAKLQGIRDERKKQTVERIFTKVNALNERVTNHFTNVLNQIDEMLNRVNSRAGKGEINGLNVSAAKIEITNAQNAITAARDAVKTQAGKVYSVQTTGNETTLKSDVGNTRHALHEDLVAAREKVKAARDAVRKAAVALAQIPRVNEVEVPTGSNNQ